MNFPGDKAVRHGVIGSAAAICGVEKFARGMKAKSGDASLSVEVCGERGDFVVGVVCLAGEKVEAEGGDGGIELVCYEEKIA